MKKLIDYSMLTYLADLFAPVRRIKVKDNEDLHGIKKWCDEEVLQAIAQRDAAFSIWHDNINRVKSDTCHL
jgi:hypothetical protein